MKTVPFSDAILALENCNVAANKRYKQGMETTAQNRNQYMLQIELSVLLNFTIHKKYIWTEVKTKITI